MTLDRLKNDDSSRRLFVLVLAFAAVYIFWGSTYLAIKYAIETLPPFLMAATRFAVAGTVLLLWARFAKEYERPTPAHWRTSFIVGTLLLLGGNGCVVFAQQYIPSSLAALLVATEPLWIAILSWTWLRQGRPNWRVSLGLLLGFAGVVLLISGRGGSFTSVSGGNEWIGIAAVILGALSWASGSIYGLRASMPRSSLMGAGMQMVAGSLSLMIVSGVRGEWFAFEPSAVSVTSVAAFFYLLVFGSLVGFTAYSWLLKNARPSTVATYAYVNPVIAVILGWLIAGETMTGQMLAGAGIVVGSVVLITAVGKKEGPAESSVAPECKTVSASA